MENERGSELKEAGEEMLTESKGGFKSRVLSFDFVASRCPEPSLIDQQPPPQLPMPMHMPLQLLLSSLGDMPSGAAHLLHTAARAGQHATVAYLLSQGVASKQSAGTGDTPLHAAVLSGDLPTVNTLIEPSKVSGWTVCSAAQNSTQGFVLCRCTLPQHSCTLSSSSNSSSPPAPSPVSSLSPSPPFLFASLSPLPHSTGSLSLAFCLRTDRVCVFIFIFSLTPSVLVLLWHLRLSPSPLLFVAPLIHRPCTATVVVDFHFQKTFRLPSATNK